MSRVYERTESSYSYMNMIQKYRVKAAVPVNMINT